MSEVLDIFFRWTGITFWCLAVGLPSLAFLRALADLVDYLRWLRHIHGRERASWRALAGIGWRSRSDFLPFGRSFTSTSIGRFSWHGLRDWREERNF
ncbi:hypothetical protein QRO11_03570 [Paracidovorax citrulli]|uniref:hypothetical protein n=1 Tax=Paracidovorax citrulli TaxID=80869 RepID=UPI0008806A08|nr:hypothetical protein [Paracidovorax citrulli]UMT89787.1 hypothetical protein FRC90_18075 [Paracidovorax citrulli]WIY35431.1 hypothetical protein QRO11_03570 [Paracidovorax citrulli]SDJ07050.1 hypothetical protein SAMN04489709_101150 [Paracidovorax citrulli]